MKHLTEEELVEHYYGEDLYKADAELHLQACGQCAQAYEELGVDELIMNGNIGHGNQESLDALERFSVNRYDAEILACVQDVRRSKART